MILLDTNVISEVARPAPNRVVAGWLDRQARADVYLCTPVVAELYYGARRMSTSVRQQKLNGFVEGLVAQKFAGRILRFDIRAAEAYGTLVAEREARGRPIDPIDAMIAAIALANAAQLATRNTRDFDLLGLDLIDPFEAIA